jgi:hypothetical protein
VAATVEETIIIVEVALVALVAVTVAQCLAGPALMGLRQGREFRVKDMLEDKADLALSAVAAAEVAAVLLEMVLAVAVITAVAEVPDDPHQ